jgi:hypothetical protein
VPRRGGVGWPVVVLAIVALALLARRLLADPG